MNMLQKRNLAMDGLHILAVRMTNAPPAVALAFLLFSPGKRRRGGP